VSRPNFTFRADAVAELHATKLLQSDHTEGATYIRLGDYERHERQN